MGPPPSSTNQIRGIQTGSGSRWGLVGVPAEVPGRCSRRDPMKKAAPPTQRLTSCTRSKVCFLGAFPFFLHDFHTYLHLFFQTLEFLLKPSPPLSLSHSLTHSCATMPISERNSHVLVFPFPAQGHMLPLLDLTHQLATHGLTITILVTPKNLPILNPLLSSSPNIQPLVLPFPPHPSLPSGVEHVSQTGIHGNVPIINALAKLHEPIIQWFNSHPNPPVAILHDFFLGSINHLADKLQVPMFSFFSSGAFFTAAVNYCSKNISPVPSDDPIVLQDLPNSPTFVWDQIPNPFRIHTEANPPRKFVKDGIIANELSSGWVVNTFDALESPYIEHLTNLLGDGKVFGVGPISYLSGSDPMTRGQSQSESGSDLDVTQWLDGKPDGSVVYVCFGSQKFLSSGQMNALTIGLEDSGIHYVWVVKTEEGVSVPSGSDRGFVISGWAPQLAILNHRAVGGFLSHCGWNSVLESILAGVMILAWPMEADQYVNARLLVDSLGAAVKVCEGTDTVPDSTELTRVIAESMSGDNNEKLKAKELKKKAIEAVNEGGSSSKELARLVKELANLRQK